MKIVIAALFVLPVACLVLLVRYSTEIQHHAEAVGVAWLVCALACAAMGMSLRRRRRRLGWALFGYGMLQFALLALPSLLPARVVSSRSSCFGNLSMILGAKEGWARDHGKTAADAPDWADLSGHYLRERPQCPANGVYSVGKMDELPDCSAAGHGAQFAEHFRDYCFDPDARRTRSKL